MIVLAGPLPTQKPFVVNCSALWVRVTVLWLRVTKVLASVHPVTFLTRLTIAEQWWLLQMHMFSSGLKHLLAKNLPAGLPSIVMAGWTKQFLSLLQALFVVILMLVPPRVWLTVLESPVNVWLLTMVFTKPSKLAAGFTDRSLIPFRKLLPTIPYRSCGMHVCDVVEYPRFRHLKVLWTTVAARIVGLVEGRVNMKLPFLALLIRCGQSWHPLTPLFIACYSSRNIGAELAKRTLVRLGLQSAILEIVMLRLAITPTILGGTFVLLSNRTRQRVVNRRAAVGP